MPRPILYSFRRCPYAMRARMAITNAKIEIEQRDILLKNKPQEMLKASPKGTVPVLILPDNAVIDESIDIMHWALNIHDPDNWLNGYNQNLINTNDNEFKANLDRYKYPNRYPNKDCSTALENCLKFIDQMEKYLTFSENINLTDIAIFPFIRQFSKVDPEMWSSLPYTKVKTWLEEQINSDLFINIMEKRPIWNSQSSNYSH